MTPRRTPIIPKEATVVLVIILVVSALGLAWLLSGSPSISNGAPPSISNVALAKVTISGYPGEIAVDLGTNRIYVSDLFANKLTVINASTYEVEGSITLPGTPLFDIAVDQEGNMVYVPMSGCTNEVNASNSCDSSTGGTLPGGIVVIDGRTDTIVGEFPVGVDRLTVNPNTGTLYGVTGSLNWGSNSSAIGFLLTIDGRTGSVIANTSLGAYPLSVAVDEDTNMVYIGACKQISLPCIGAEVLSVNGTSHAVTSVVPLNFDALNFNVVVDPVTNTVYTMGEESSLTLVSIDGTSGAIKYLSDIGGSCAGAGGGTLALNTASDQVYVTFDGQQLLLSIDGSSGAIDNMVNASGGIQSVAFNPNDGRIYVTMEAQNENVGYLLVLPGTMSQSYVDNSLLPTGMCYP